MPATIRSISLPTVVHCLLALTIQANTAHTMERLSDIDSLIRQKLEKVPHVGLAVGIVDGGRTIFTKGYGLRDTADPGSHVTNRTIFAIGSCTKAFTSYALDQLISVDGLLDWDDLVTSHIPEFRTSNAHTTEHVTIKDLLSHTTGMARHDAVWTYSNLTRNELLTRLPHLATGHYLRQEYRYNNIMYAVAGIVTERASGLSWEEVIRKRIFEPLDMTRTYAHITDAWAAKAGDIAQPYGVSYTDGPKNPSPVPWNSLFNVAPSGSIVSSVEDMTKWIRAQLELRGRSKIMHSAHINMPLELSDHFNFAYALGWVLGYHRGRYIVWHNGRVDGFCAYVALFPQQKQGIVILANVKSMLDSVTSLVYEIADLLASNSSAVMTSNDHGASKSSKKVKSDDGASEQETVVIHKAVEKPEQYVGKFKNLGYGETEVVGDESGRLFAVFNTLKYALVPKKGADFFSARAPFPREAQCELSFVRDSSSGDVNALRFDFETTVEPILFEKEVAEEFRKLEYLNSFSGVYEQFEVSVSRGRCSLVIFDGSGSSPFTGAELRPYKRDWFRSEGRELFEFQRGRGGNVTALLVHLNENAIIFWKNGTSDQA